MKITVDEIGNWHFNENIYTPAMPVSALTILIQSELNLKRPFVIDIQKVKGKTGVKKDGY